MFFVLCTFLWAIDAYGANETCGFVDANCIPDVDDCCDPLMCIAGNCEPFELGLGSGDQD